MGFSGPNRMKENQVINWRIEMVCGKVVQSRWIIIKMDYGLAGRTLRPTGGKEDQIVVRMWICRMA